MSRIEFDGAGVDVLDGAGAPREILSGVSLTLTEQRIAVVGANGSGKSTLLRLLNGLVLPTRGAVRVDGLDTRTAGAKVRRIVGFGFTDPLSQLVMPTPREDVELSLRRVHRDRKERRRTAQALLANFGLERLADQSIYELSGGERQLLALVTLLAVEPRVLVLDEPSTLLDLRNRELLRRVLSGLAQQVVFSTHDLELALDAERVLVVDDGGIVFDGAPHEAVDRYRTLAGARDPGAP
ncbi:energy-coupling factor ABC transporter ATP-binding protein [Paenarthrobacter sp. DKR-5]|uniref:energy-coupling factor ABC transporter ATP-binding protein n=1 Tax=Paenarthrobacter sp. DKR-5 TaxID=2835535 RepID=UPI001BDD939E|nr:ABC transporter ATP-binding protein [Paenarthrobacter sp. DKR-5]MBT1001839.1 energy-coupling factor ABC transporter ATP-binding protein [Paenarthrobacter sp. DKR-5]